jgi:hypothetical protein
MSCLILSCPPPPHALRNKAARIITGSTLIIAGLNPDIEPAYPIKPLAISC